MAKKITNDEAAAEVPATASEGENTAAEVPASTTEGGKADTGVPASTAEGKKAVAGVPASPAEGEKPVAGVPASPAEGEKPVAGVPATIPDHADRILRTLTGYAELYIDPQGGTFTVDSPPALRAAATRYTNPYYKRP